MGSSVCFTDGIGAMFLAAFIIQSLPTGFHDHLVSVYFRCSVLEEKTGQITLYGVSEKGKMKNMQMLYRIPLFLIGSMLVVYGLVSTIRLWPRDFFISESERTRRSTKIGTAGAIFVFGVFQLMLVFINEDVTFFQLISNLCFLGPVSVAIGVVAGASAYRQLRLMTKSKDDIGTIRDK